MGIAHSTPKNIVDDIILENALVNHDTKEVSLFANGKQAVRSRSGFFENPVHFYHAIMHQDLEFFKLFCKY